MNSLRWIPGATPPAFTPADLMICLYRLREPLYIIRRHWGGELGLATGGHLSDQPGVPFGEGCHVAGILPALAPESLGESSFCETHGLRYAYIAGEMANGISTAHMVSAMARAGMLGFFGAAGLEPDVIEDVVVGLRRELGELRNWGVNVIHVPGRPDREEQVVDLLLRRGVVNISASAFVHLTPALVRCAVHGLRTDPSGQIVRRVHLFAKVSRPEVATFFMSPPPEDMLRMLVERGHITEAEATLGARIPLADNITVEADSGGHTDNRPLVVALPTILALRDELSKRFGYADPIYVGAAGGLGTPSAVAAAFTLGADYVLTGSINQLAIEAGISATAKELLATADLADVAMAPSADMFELGVKVQVLRRGTFFAARAGQLYEVYRSHPSIEAIPHEIRTKLETQVLHASFDHIWQQTTDFWHKRDPEQLAAARRNPKYRMALIFRWYLGMSSRWAIDGSTARRGDYQLWCGPAAGAFNRWVSESFLADPSQRSVVQIARNLMEGAAVVNRAHQLRVAGVALPTEAFRFVPRLLDVSA
ncbi:PfaD family polyunsaturated fatty acid/polyketide biosynthesis protein [Mycolicibacterium fluoranthenivorans]|nr:PfaD family polyunsaturated fatty acid/polyketide biosynthesis protein [Mycolicibacterium fluoranthenivorans]